MADLTDELTALLDEHDRFVAGMPVPNSTSNVYYVELLTRIAETLDPLLGGPSPAGVAPVVQRACSTLGLALFVADLSDLVVRGSRLPATSALRRWFPEARLAELRREALGTTTATG